MAAIKQSMAKYAAKLIILKGKSFQDKYMRCISELYIFYKALKTNPGIIKAGCMPYNFHTDFTVADNNHTLQKKCLVTS